MKKDGTFIYYASEYYTQDAIETKYLEVSQAKFPKKNFSERVLHTLFSTYLNSVSIHSKTIAHEKSKVRYDRQQKWTHPDMIGVSFATFKSNIVQNFIGTINKSQTLKIFSYEMKRNC